MNLTGKIALVTGASRGLGKGIALELGRAGATVYVTARTVQSGSAELPGTIGETAREISQSGGVGIAVACDQTDDEKVGVVFERIASEQGRIDILVNSAASLESKAERLEGKRQKFWEAPLSQWNMYHNVGLRSHYVTSVHAARMMAAAGRGLIVNVSSAGAVEYFRCVAYGAAKAALDKMTADTAVELRKRGVAVVSIWPGLTRTEMTTWMSEAGLMDISTAETPSFSGRAVVALAGDANILQRSGKAFFVADLAHDYGFTDVDGTVHPRPDMSRITIKRS